MGAVVLNLNVDVNALLTTVKDLAWELANSCAKSNSAKEKFASQVNRLSLKHDFWQQQVTTFGLQSNSILTDLLRQAASVLETAAVSSADQSRTSRCCSWSQTKKAASPPWTELEKRIVIVINALDSITSDLRKQREDQAELQKVLLEKSRFSLGFRIDRRYVRLQRTEDSVSAELAVEGGDGPLVVLLHGEPGTGKSALARNLALQFEAEAKATKAAKAAKERSPSLEASSSTRTLSPLFERVIWLECGPQVKFEEAQLKLREQLGWVASAVNENAENPYGSKDDIKTAIKNLLSNQKLLIIFDDVHDPYFLQQMLLLCSPSVKCLVTSQDGNLRLNCRLAKVPMEDIGNEDARRILASHIGLDDQLIPEEIQGQADDIIQTIGANPLAISCMARAIHPRRVEESREWVKAAEELSESLDCDEGSLIHSTPYGASCWGALRIAFERLTKQERNLLVLVSICEGPSVPEEVLEFLYERALPKIANSSSKFQASRTHLEMRQHIVISGEQQQRSWRIHSLLHRFITEKKKEDRTAMFNVFYGLSTTGSTAGSYEGVLLRDEDIVNVLCAVYFNKEYADKISPKMFVSLHESNNVRRNVIESVTRLLVLKENSYSKWTPVLIDCVKQVFMKYISDGVLHESSVLSLLMSPLSTIPVLQALNQVTRSGSKVYASPSCIEDILDALFKILGSVLKKGNKSDYASINRNSLISHIKDLLPKLLQERNIQNNISLIFKRNFLTLEAIVGTLTVSDDKNSQAEATTILGSIAVVEAAFEMANFPGLLEGLLVVIKSMDQHQNYELKLQALSTLSSISSGVVGACSDIRLSVGSGEFSSILKELANLCCESKSTRLLVLASLVICTISMGSFCSGDVESIRIIKSLYEEGLFEGVINLIEPQNVITESDPQLEDSLGIVGLSALGIVGLSAAIAVTLVDPVKSKKLRHLFKSTQRLGRGLALALRGQYEDSIEDLEEGYKDQLETSEFATSEYPSEKIYVKVKLGDLRGALADADSWINMKLPNQEAFQEAFQERGVFKRIMEEAFQERGVLKRIMGDWDGALMDLDKSLRLSPDNYEVLKHRGYVKFLMRTDEEGARADAERALSIKPRRVDRPGYNKQLYLGETPVKFLHFDLN